MKNLISRISQIFPTISRKENYVRILKFLEKDAENCYDSVVGKYVDISANKLKKAIEFVYETDKSNSSLILFPCLRMPKYKIILNFLDDDVKKLEDEVIKIGKNGEVWEHAAEAAYNLALAIDYLKADCMEVQHEIV